MTEKDIGIVSTKQLTDFLESESRELSRFSKHNRLPEHESAYRAFKFGIKFILYGVKFDADEEGNIRLDEMTGSESFIEIYSHHLPFFMSMDMVDLKPRSWMLMNMTDTKIYLLLKPSKLVKKSYIVNKLTEIKEIATNRADWAGRLFYKTLYDKKQHEIK